ncbi:MAG: trypsin-like serine protease [Armatimonadota bacterium]|nr:trypsin-like serine protease [Armatimonadota bacterium]
MRVGRFTILLVAIATCLLWTSQALAIVWRDDMSESDYIGLATFSEFATVGRVFSVGLGAGSGTLIADGRWVLTAAHVVYGAPAVLFELGSSLYDAVNVFIHPGYAPGSFAHDIALIQLNTVVPNITPAALYTGNLELGAVGYSVGYGLGGNGLTGYSASAYPYGTKRAMQNVIDLIIDAQGAINPEGTFLLSDFDSPSGNTNTLAPFSSEPTPLQLEGMGAPGDSGGPVFILQDNRWYVAGVHSFISGLDGAADASYGDILGSTRVSSYNSWIVSVVPEPSSLAVLGAGVLALAFRFRRRAP